MICPRCQRPTARMVYRRTGKLCEQCADSNRVEFAFIEPPSNRMTFAALDLILALLRGDTESRIHPYAQTLPTIDEFAKNMPFYKYAPEEQIEPPPAHR